MSRGVSKRTVKERAERRAYSKEIPYEQALVEVEGKAERRAFWSKVRMQAEHMKARRRKEARAVTKAREQIAEERNDTSVKATASGFESNRRKH